MSAADREDWYLEFQESEIVSRKRARLTVDTIGVGQYASL